MFVICTVVQFYSDSLLQVVDDFTIATNFPRSIFDKGRPICINIYRKVASSNKSLLKHMQAFTDRL